MSVLLPNSAFGWVRADAAELDRKLREGDGIHWSGDPTLWLGQGVVEETRGGRPTGKIVARQWQVWSDAEDGSTQLIGTWRMEEFDRILFDLARMRADSAGHEDVLDRIDRNNAAVEAKNAAAFRDSYGEMLAHLADIAAERRYGKNRFRQMPGRDPNRQM